MYNETDKTVNKFYKINRNTAVTVRYDIILIL